MLKNNKLLFCFALVFCLFALSNCSTRYGYLPKTKVKRFNKESIAHKTSEEAVSKSIEINETAIKLTHIEPNIKLLASNPSANKDEKPLVNNSLLLIKNIKIQNSYSVGAVSKQTSQIIPKALEKKILKKIQKIEKKKKPEQTNRNQTLWIIGWVLVILGLLGFLFNGGVGAGTLLIGAILLLIAHNIN